MRPLQALCCAPILIAFALLIGCASGQRGDTIRGMDDGIANWVTDEQLLLRSYDSTGDGQSDVFRHLAVLDEDGERIEDISNLRRSEIRRTRTVRLEMDLNGDGHIDIRREYDERENLTREHVTSALLGQRTLENHFQGGSLIMRRVDRNGDGHFEEVWHYRNGNLQRIEFDLEGRGHPTRWHYFRDDILTRIGRDLTGDGVIDQWEVLQADRGELELRQRQPAPAR